MQLAELELVDESDPNSQKVAVLEAPYRISTARAKIPEPGENEVRVKVKWVGVCGSDVEVYRGTRKPEYLSMPTRLGHEVAGVIDKLGSNVQGINVGDQGDLPLRLGSLCGVRCLPAFQCKETTG